MCIEFFLALFYFFTLFLVNFFLFQWIKKDFQKNLFFLRIKNMEAFVSKEQFVPFFSFFQLFQNEILPETISLYLTNEFTKKDVILLGAFYHQFQKKARVNSSSYYYWKLLEMQFL